MCMEDVRIGREETGGIHSVSVATTATPLVGGSKSRVALILSSHTTATITYSTDPNIVVNGGLVMGPGQMPVILSIQEVGGIVRMAWYAIASAGPSIVGVGESFLARE